VRLDQLQLSVPPLMLTAAAAVLIVLSPPLHLPYLSGALAWGLGALVMAVGAAIGLLGVVAFRRARTTVHPRHPERSSCMVQTGVYARTRNPMYLGFVAVLLGLSIGVQSLPGIVLTALAAAYLHRCQILPEERWLRQRFGDEFVAYCSRVARWL
jgi:protein-S-isoprenylcysteine O-methyltransferase Ste14